jgi:hypothetical protein
MAHAASLGVAGAHEQLIRPCLEAGRVAELRQALPDPQQGLLRRILGKFAVPKDAMCHCLEPPSVGDDKRGEGFLISSLSRHHQLGIHPSPRGALVNASVTPYKCGSERAFLQSPGIG